MSPRSTRLLHLSALASISDGGHRIATAKHIDRVGSGLSQLVKLLATQLDEQRLAALHGAVVEVVEEVHGAAVDGEQVGLVESELAQQAKEVLARIGAHVSTERVHSLGREGLCRPVEAGECLFGQRFAVLVELDAVGEQPVEYLTEAGQTLVRLALPVHGAQQVDGACQMMMRICSTRCSAALGHVVVDERHGAELVAAAAAAAKREAKQTEWTIAGLNEARPQRAAMHNVRRHQLGADRVLLLLLKRRTAAVEVLGERVELDRIAAHVGHVESVEGHVEQTQATASAVVHREHEIVDEPFDSHRSIALLTLTSFATQHQKTNTKLIYLQYFKKKVTIEDHGLEKLRFLTICF